MSRRSLGLALILSLALNLSTLAAAVYFRCGGALHHPSQRSPDGGASIGSRLELTQSQQEQVRAINRQFMEEVAPLRVRIRAANTELARAAISGAADPARTARLLDKSADLHRELQEHASRYLGREAMVLTPPQRERLAEAIKGYICSGACPHGSGAGMGLGVLSGEGPRDP